MILRVGNGRDAMLFQGAKHVFEQATESFRGKAAALIAGGERDAKLHLVRFLLRAVQAAIANHALRRSLDDCDLKPGPRNTWLAGPLVFNEA